MTRTCASRSWPAATSSWACGRPAKWASPATKAKEYAIAVVQADFEEAGDEDVFRKVRADFDAARIAQSDSAIRAKMEELLSVAGEQVAGEK